MLIIKAQNGQTEAHVDVSAIVALVQSGVTTTKVKLNGGHEVVASVVPSTIRDAMKEQLEDTSKDVIVEASPSPPQGPLTATYRVRR